MRKNGGKVLILGLLMTLFLVPPDSLGKSKKKVHFPFFRETGYDVDDVLKVHNIGKLWTAVGNYGVYGDPEVPDRFPSYEWPGGSGTHYQWEGRFWIGAIVGGEKLVSHADYGDYELHPNPDDEYQPWIYPAEDDFLLGWSGVNPVAGQMKSLQDSYVVFDDFTRGNNDPLGVKMLQRGLSWSVKDLDDLLVFEVAVINEPGVGPGTLDDLYVSWVFDSDCGVGADPTSPHIDDLVDYDGYDGDDGDTDERDWVENYDWNESGELDGYDEYGVPWGMQYHASPNIVNPNYDLSKNTPDGFFDEYSVIIDPNGPELVWQNTVMVEGSDGTTIQAVAGQQVEIDGEIIHGYCVPRNMSFIYDGDDPTTPEYDAGERQATQKVPGYISGRLLYSPIMMDNPVETIPVDELLMVSAHMWWNWNSDPGSDIQKYDFMDATHADAKGKHFMPHPFDIGAPEFDYRFLLSTGPFNDFQEGDTLKFVYASGVGLGLRGARENMDNALTAYYSGSSTGNPYNPTSFDAEDHWKVPVPPPVPNLVYSPLDEGAQLAWDNKAETTIDDMLGTVDFEGYKVYRAMYAPEGWQLIYACDIVDGEVKVIDHDTGDSLATLDLDEITHTFIDTGGTFLGAEYDRPVNGLPYYYVVTAYDPVKAELGLPSIESARANFMIDSESGAPLPVTPRKLYSEDEDPDLSSLDIRVVPNPYRGAALFEARYEEKVIFTNLPRSCKISIFSASGDLVKIIEHTDASSTEFWDLVSRNNQDVVSGLYLYIVETSDASATGKFVIIR
ncbi:MAG: T9SS type A sorting domain-containing protein [Candidatus Poseidoniia archaeon]|jgi:hypothetical protein|nr:hypothetical protein [Rhodospirillaceae bacterium]MDP6592360.1 T9SS type A sorting domain-containing protein [Candidatus Poseidoniia archaeon]HJL71817.1 T9SS type A sorting domain-containing protein [Candidatus Poseidoniia archaeon]|tara:strand:+ start:3083 stop:5431 length:2349 start_codon:yes stop_codon:yes gene_type:complete